MLTDRSSGPKGSSRWLVAKLGLPALVAAGASAALFVGWATRLAEPWAWVVGLALGANVVPPVGNQPTVDWVAVEQAVRAAEERGPDTKPARDAQKVPAVQSKRPSRGAEKKPGPAPNVRSLRVAEDTILRLSRVASPPASRFVERSGQRPAGLQLAGVSALGIGVNDGDVLTRVAGASVTSRASVIATVLKLRARKAPVISGEFWRGQQRWVIAVEMPYVQPPLARAKAPEGRAKAPSAVRSEANKQPVKP